MAKFTVSLRELEATFGREEIIKWFCDYPLEAVLKREEIESINEAQLWSKEQMANEIIDWFYLREIGYNNPGEFKHRLKNKLRILSHFFLPLVFSESIKYNPLVNVDYKEIYEGERKDDGKSSTASTGENSDLTVNSDTPQGQISKSTILQGEYASSTTANEGESKSNIELKSDNVSTEGYTKHFIGNSGVSATAQKMIEQYRENILNITQNVIIELSDLFVSIF